MYKVEFRPQALKELKKIDRTNRAMILSWIEKNLMGCENPRARGKGLTANRSGQWRYRVGDYRIIVEIKDNELLILALSVGQRSTVYGDLKKYPHEKIPGT